MPNDTKKRDIISEGSEADVRVESLSDLIPMNLKIYTNLVNDKINLKKAQLLFNGSNAITGALKVALQCKKLGFTHLAGVHVGDIQNEIK
jgi:hypothetical protein